MEQLLVTIEGVTVPSTASEDAKALLRQLNYVNGRTTFHVNRVNTIAASTGFLQSTLSSIGALKEKLEKIETELSTLDELPEEHVNRIGDRLLNLESFVQNALTRLLNQAHEATAANTSSRSTRSDVRLPDLVMPEFDGTPKKWLRFRKFVNDVLVPHPAHDSTKLVHLTNCVSGEAQAIVLSAGESFVTAVDGLKERFDNDVEVLSELIQEIYDIKRPRDNDPVTLNEFVTMTEININYLKQIKAQVDQWDPFLCYHLLRRLDTPSRQEFEKQRNPIEQWKTAELVKFLKTRVRVLNCSKNVSTFSPKVTSTPIQAAKKTEVKRETPSRSFAALEGQPSTSKQCPLCNENHPLFACPKAKTMTVDDLKKVVASSRLCYNCLKPGHIQKQCPSTHKCKTCDRRHHTLLHIDSTSPNDSSTDSNDKAKHESVNVAIGGPTIAVLATAVVHIQDRWGNNIQCRAFLDGGSTVSFITTELADSLKLKKQNTYTLIDGINGSETVNKYQVTAVVSSRISDYSTEVDLLVTKRITGDMPQRPLPIDPSKLPDGMTLADPAFHTPGKIDLLLGSDIFYDVLSGPKIALDTQLWSIPSQFGNLIVGKISKSPKAYTFLAIDELRKLIQNFWEIETATSKQPYSIEEKAAEQHFVEHVSRRADNHYEVALPLKSNVTQLGDSSIKSQQIFCRSERRLASNAEKKGHYADFIQEMMDMGHLNVVQNSDHNSTPYFMTHHLISRPSSTTTKHRVVFNASFKTTSGLSLNDTLLIGPSIQAELFTHLIRWREFMIGLTADIAKMYRMIFVREADRHYQQIWWRFEPTDELKAYQIATVTYGTSSAPFQATRVLKRLAEDESLNYSDVVSDLENNFYIDDYSSSTVDLDTAIQKKHRLTDLLSKGGFCLRKWQSNEPSLEDATTESPITTVLGVKWDKSTDDIIVDFSEIKQHEHLTKCNVLSEIAQMFDPLGLIAPVVILAKIFMQKLWTDNLTWDELLTDEMADEWLNFREQIQSLPSIRVKRPLITSSTRFALHGFSDASTTAYGACVYLVNNGISTLVCSKSRVAPLKTLTVPRLELCAALLLAQLMSRVLHSFATEPDEIYLWTDSEITYFRINSPPSKFASFVATRIAEIQSLSAPSKWRFIPGELNPADVVSRGMSIDQLINHQQWWCGPKFIYDNNYKWPTQKLTKSTTEDTEVKQISAVAIERSDIEIEEIVKRFMTWEIALNILAKNIRFYLNLMKSPQYRLNGVVTLQEKLEVQLRILRRLQEEVFDDEFKLLQKKCQLPVNNKLTALNPFLDEDGLMRVGGRLGRAPIPFNQQHPVILPKGHITYRLLNMIHRKNLHAGPQALLSYSRQEYWIIGGRTQSKQVVHNCIICFKSKPKLLKQIMADVPAERTQCKRAFDVVGVDFTGYLFIKPLIRSRALRKCYVCLFTCFATRATHLEVVHDLTTTGFINALRRFISRRGIPQKIYSDNATNFVGAQDELAELREMMLSTETDVQVQKFCVEHCIQFLTIPARSPHHGGLWESMIKQFKHHFKRSVPPNVLHIDEMETLVIQCEAVLNSRPLTPVSESADDLGVLTPGHFLIGQPLNLLPEPTWKDETPNRLKSWQLIQKVTEEIWQLFRNDYFHELQRRNKWKITQDDLKIGTMVLLHDELPPTQWKFGRVSEVYRGTDKHVRSAEVKTQHGTFKRAITKIAPLPFEP